MSDLPERNYWSATAGPSTGPALDADRTAEVAVIGGGLTGLAAAYHLAADHGVEPVVLEAHEPGWGASGRNAGMVVPAVSKLSIAERRERWGPDAARRSGAIGREAVERVRALIESERIACDAQPPGWLQVAHRASAAGTLAAAARAHRELLGDADVSVASRRTLAEMGALRGAAAHGAVHVKHAFGLHPLKYVRGLAAVAERRGAAIFSRSPVETWTTSSAGTHVLRTRTGTVRAPRVIVATDAYTPRHLHPYFRGRVLATGGAVMVTRPLTRERWAAVGIHRPYLYTDTRKILAYWRRLPDDRLLFGSRGPGLRGAGRHPDWLRRRLAATLPELGPLEADYYWTGAIGLTYDRAPHVSTVDGDPSVAYAMGYLGTGIALATYWGRTLAAVVTGSAPAADTPMTGRGLPRFPLPALRRHYFGLARIGYELRDRYGRP